MKNFLKILIALMLGMSVIFTAVSCGEEPVNSKVEDDDDKKDKDENDVEDNNTKTKEEPQKDVEDNNTKTKEEPEKVENKTEPEEEVNVEETPLFKTILEESMEATEDIDNYSLSSKTYFDLSVMGMFFEMTMDSVTERDGDVERYYSEDKIDSSSITAISETYYDCKENKEYACVDGVWEIDDYYGLGSNDAYDIVSLIYDMENADVSEVIYGNIECYEITGAVAVDFLELMRENSETEDAEIDEDLLERIFSEKVPLTVELGIDKETYYPVYYEFDLTDMANTYFGEATDYAAEVSGEDDVDSNVKDLRASGKFTNYGDVSVEIPVDEINYSIYYSDYAEDDYYYEY